MNVLQAVSNIVNRNAPVILTVVSTAGVFATAVLAGKATLEASDRVRELEKHIDRDLSIREIVEVSWKYYIPTAILAVSTSAAIIGMHSIHTKRATALFSAYTLTDTAFKEYQSKVSGVLGEKKERALREQIAAEQIKKSPPPENRETVVIGNGTVLCLETSTGRYFWSTVEKILQAQNTINARIIHDMYASQNDFYSLIGLPTTTLGDQLGWTIDAMMEVVFGSELDPENRPCLAVDYRISPRSDYYKLH